MKSGATFKSIALKFVKITAWVTGSVILLLLILIALIRLPYIQNKITQKAIGFLENKIGTPVTLQSITLSFPKKIVLTGLHIQDQHQDTLLYAGSIKVDTDLWKLLDHSIQLNDVELIDLTAHINRSDRDSAFNFNYIITAFAGDSTSVKDTTSRETPWIFAVYGVSIENAKVKFDDYYSGTLLHTSIKSLTIDVDEFDLVKSIIIADAITLSGAAISFEQTKLPIADATAEPFSYRLGVSSVKLNDIKARYYQHALGQIIRVTLSDAEVKADEIDIMSQRMALQKFSLDDAFLSYQQLAGYKIDSAEVSLQDTTHSFKPWSIALQDLDIKNTAIQYYDFDKPMATKGVDFAHLWLTQLNINAEDLKNEGNMLEGKLNEFSLQERSGFGVQSLRTNFKINNTQATLDHFELLTEGSKIRFNADARFSSLTTLSEKYADTKIEVDIDNTLLALRDVEFFSPQLFDSIPLHLQRVKVNVDARVKGRVDDLLIDRLKLHALKNTEVQANGSLKGLPDMMTTRVALTLEKFHTTNADIDYILVDSLQPKSVNLPEWITLVGNYTGTFKTPVLNAVLTSSVGGVRVKGSVDFDSLSKTYQHYNATVTVDSVDVGKLMKAPVTMGKLTLHSTIKGHGFSMDNIDAAITVTVNEFQYQGYQYKNFNIKGNMREHLFTGSAALHDENLDFTLNGKLNYSKATSIYNVDLDLNNVDFKALKITSHALKARGKLNAVLNTPDFKIMNGNVNIHDVDIYNGQKLYSADSFLTASIMMDKKTSIRINSDLIKAEFDGSMSIADLPASLQHYFNNYFSPATKQRNITTSSENFTFNVMLKNSELLHNIILPELREFNPGVIKGEFISDRNHLDIEMIMGSIRYSNLSTDSIRVMVHSDKRSLLYSAMAKNLRYDTLLLRQLAFDGSARHDSLQTRLAILDSLEQKKYQITGVIRKMKDIYQFHFAPDQLVLNYEKWAVPADNYIQFGRGIQANAVRIASNGQTISLQTKNDKDSTLVFGFQNLDLKNISRIVTEREALIDGKLDGEFRLLMVKKGGFNSNLKISQLTILEQLWGNLTLDVSRATADRFDVNMLVKGANADIDAKGAYVVNPESSTLDVKAVISKLSLSIIEPFTNHQLTAMNGNISGEITMGGTTNKPLLNGKLNFNKVGFTSTYVNNAFTINNETLTFNNEGIHFNNFDILDANNNTARLNGDVLTTSYNHFNFDFTLVTKKFQVLNTTAKENDLYYGKVWVNANAKITGSEDLPIIDVEVGLSEESELTYIVPESEKGVTEQKGIVVFIDKDAKNDPFLANIKPQDTVTNNFKGIDLTANIELTDGEKFNIIIDPLTGDKLSVQGNTTLTLKLDHTGNIELAGRYEISKGTYNLSFYKLVKREFQIQKGGTLVWTGDPLNAMLDLQALYQVETSPYELVSSQIAASAQDQYRQRLPFLVYLNINGELLKPEISFKLDMPVDKQSAFGGGVYAKITDINSRESELNKQVFSLLVLKRFMADNPFDTQSSPLSSTARNSVSKLLTEQLNRLSENVKGVTLNFDVKSYDDYSTGQAQGQTKLQLGVSKNLFNDRLVVKLSGNVDIEGETSQQNSFTDFIGDLALEYKLTADGRLRLTGFRSGDYDMIDGELIKTGAGLIYIKDYDSFQELFKSDKKENK